LIQSEFLISWNGKGETKKVSISHGYVRRFKIFCDALCIY